MTYVYYRLFQVFLEVILWPIGPEFDLLNQLEYVSCRQTYSLCLLDWAQIRKCGASRQVYSELPFPRGFQNPSIKTAMLRGSLYFLKITCHVAQATDSLVDRLSLQLLEMF